MQHPFVNPSWPTGPCQWRQVLVRYSPILRRLDGSLVALLDESSPHAAKEQKAKRHRGSTRQRGVRMPAGEYSTNNHCIFRFCASGLHAKILQTVTWTNACTTQNPTSKDTKIHYTGYMYDEGVWLLVCNVCTCSCRLTCKVLMCIIVVQCQHPVA